MPECFAVQWHPYFLPLPPVTQQRRDIKLAALVPDFHEGAEEDLVKIEFLFRREGDFAWQTAATKLGGPSPTSLSSLSDWRVPAGLQDGEYELIIVATCNSTESRSSVIPMFVDLTPLETFSISPPADTPLKKTEAISFLFNKELDCPRLMANVTAVNSTVASSLSSLKINCQLNEVQILLSSSFHDSLMGRKALVSLTVSSLSGYTLTQTLEVSTGWSLFFLFESLLLLCVTTFSFLSSFLSFFFFF
jgi:hypothetical protein